MLFTVPATWDFFGITLVYGEVSITLVLCNLYVLPMGVIFVWSSVKFFILNAWV